MEKWHSSLIYSANLCLESTLCGKCTRGEDLEFGPLLTVIANKWNSSKPDCSYFIYIIHFVNCNDESNPSFITFVDILPHFESPSASQGLIELLAENDIAITWLLVLWWVYLLSSSRFMLSKGQFMRYQKCTMECWTPLLHHPWKNPKRNFDNTRLKNFCFINKP